MILVLAMLLAACGDLPVEPVEEVDGEIAEWCSPYAGQLEGHWTRAFALRGHAYTSGLTLTVVEPCVLAYSVDMVQVPHEGQEQGMKVYETQGRIVVTGYESEGPLGRFAIDGRRTFEQTFGDHGATVRNEAPAIFEREEITLWGNSLKLWGNTYQRKDEQ